MVADSNHFDEELDPNPDPDRSDKSDPNPHQCEKRDPDPHQCERILNTALKHCKSGPHKNGIRKSSRRT